MTVVSTEAYLRDTIVTALEAIAVTKLGFEAGSINIRNYLYEHVADALKSNYLACTIAGVKKAQAWSVWVNATDEYYALGNVYKRFYNTVITGYVELGADGAGAKYLIDSANSIRSMLLNLNLSGVVDTSQVISAININNAFGSNNFGSILTGEISFSSYKESPNFI